MTSIPVQKQISQAFESLSVETEGPDLLDQTAAVGTWLALIGATDGLLTLMVRHTSASLLIQENADPDVQVDMLDALDRLAPRNQPYAHEVEGPDDMPAHIKSALTQTSLSIPVKDGRMLLGTWQGIYLVEHRDRPHHREIALHFIGTMTG
ncbi:YjbQ family protein [Hyphomicrobium sp. 1Nfss2.1]|uniref:secondary thiamine-phosphate synthase enzyme YjbQ n=1 Tax=Hyphomicrobium sp. 1Nfss2.1 TaxID=3413936 RepID=UPI003C79D377